MLWICCILSFFLQEQRTSPKPGEEGDLNNRSYLFSPGIEVETLVKSAGEAIEKTDWRACESLFRQIADSREAIHDENQPMIALDSRLSLGIHEWLSVKMRRLPFERRSKYQSYFDGRLMTELAKLANDERTLRRFASNYPFTDAAASAWIRLGDLAFERADPTLAESFYRQAEREDLGSSSTDQIQKRIQALAALKAKDAPQKTPNHEIQKPQLEWSATIDAEGSDQFRFLTLGKFDDKLFAQTPQFLYVYDLEGSLIQKLDLDTEAFDRKLILDRGLRPKRAWESVNPLEPLILHPQVFRDSKNNQWIFLVHGDAETPYFAKQLVGMRWDSEKARFQVAWKRGWGQEDQTELAGLTVSSEFLIHGSRIYIGAQKVKGDISSFLLCFDAETGKLLWKRFLCKGSPSYLQGSRLLENVLTDVSGLAPVVRDGCLFYGGNLGILAAVDAGEGKLLWCLRYARKKEAKDGWLRGSIALDDELLFAPSDSDFFYKIRATRFPVSDSGGSDVFPEPPRRRDNANFFLGSVKGVHFFLEDAHGQAQVVGASGNFGNEQTSARLAESADLFSGTISGKRLYLLSTGALFELDLSNQLRVESLLRFAEPVGTPPLSFSAPCVLPDRIAFIVSNKLFVVQGKP